MLEALRGRPLNVTAVVQRRPEGSPVFYALNDNVVFKLMAQAEKRLLASRRQHLDALAARDQRACT
ncbi:hypothetical protein [Vulcanococcus sp.]|uniref:hypothetical protein n=1 Tax=Vulcanococcus sp. TaxID=2856995 RepID=UPI003F699938